ncbi:hypothetical protein [Mycolicibacterium gadium]|uniref:Uncharacterized protein n=1 Tax=Mycolicibacterium gadium TaxID=1794 RepID=A0ABT6GPL0_MYCGU|nr:hypothetical protein [Mycolicibacterium gadium]MDG5483006.1 hypothetical protein [Mycolicibacterium gadium]
MKRATAICSGLFCVSFGVFTAAWTVIFVVRGEFLNAVVAFGFATFCFGFLIPLFTVIPGKAAPRVNVDEGGTTFWPDRSVEMPLYIGLLGAVTACAVYTIFAPAGRVTISIPHAMRYSLPFTSGVLLLMGVPMLWRYFRRGSTKYLRLTPSGFELEESWRTESGEWDQVKNVTDESSDKKWARSGPIVFVMSDDRTAMIAASAMTPDGKALRELVRFYWEHPEVRDELTDGKAVERLARSLA